MSRTGVGRRGGGDIRGPVGLCTGLLGGETATGAISETIKVTSIKMQLSTSQRPPRAEATGESLRYTMRRQLHVRVPLPQQHVSVKFIRHPRLMPSSDHNQTGEDLRKDQRSH